MVQTPNITHTALLVGLGGGSLPRYLNGLFPMLKVTAVEVEPAVVHLAERYFGIRSSERLNVIVSDIRTYLDGLDESVKFDFIFHDGCDENGFVPVLNSKEFLGSLSLRMKSGGVLASNIIFLGNDNNSQILKSYKDTISKYQEVFPHMTLLCLYDGHTMLFASNNVAFEEGDDEEFVKSILRLNELDSKVDYRAFIRLSNHYKKSLDWEVLCSNFPSPLDSLQKLSLTIENQSHEDLELYWDKDPVRFFRDCSKYPFQQHLIRSMQIRGIVSGQSSFHLDVMQGETYFLVKPDEGILIDCLTAIDDNYAWTVL